MRRNRRLELKPWEGEGSGLDEIADVVALTRLLAKGTPPPRNASASLPLPDLRAIARRSPPRRVMIAALGRQAEQRIRPALPVDIGTADLSETKLLIEADGLRVLLVHVGCQGRMFTQSELDQQSADTLASVVRIDEAPPPGPTTRFDHPDARLSRPGRGQARPEMGGSPHPGFIADT
ncbi:hypothetical protein D3C85_765850 [compost metagenome]